MATIAGVGKSNLPRAPDAGREAAAKALERLPRAPDLVLVFATVGYDQPALLSGVVEAAGDVPLSGCSAEGVITQEGSDEGYQAVTVMAIASDQATFDVFQVTGLSQGARQCGAALAERIVAAERPNGKGLLLFPDALKGNCSALLCGLQERLPSPLVIAGGGAGELIQYKTTYQYYNGHAATDAVSAVLISGDVVLDTVVSAGCAPIGNLRTVTSSDGSWVHSIDGLPAWNVYKEYADPEPVDFTDDVSTYFSFGEPISSDASHRKAYGKYLIRTPHGFDKRTGALFFPGALAENTKLRLMRRDLDRIREGAKSAARAVAARHPGKRPTLVFQFECAGRGRNSLGEGVTEATVTPLQSVLGRDIPWLGLYCYGEIATLEERAYYQNWTVVLCAWYEAA